MRCAAISSPAAMAALLVASLGAAHNPAAPVRIADGFERGDIAPWHTRFRPIQFTISDGELVGKQLDPGHVATIHREMSPTGDLRYEFDAKFAGATALGANVGDDTIKDIVHFGHVANFNLKPGSIRLQDDVTGWADKTRFHHLPPKERAEATKSTRVSASLAAPVEAGEWHHYTFEFRGDTARVLIDGIEVIRHTSPGFAHPAKNRVSLSVADGPMHFDNLKVTAL